MLLAQVTDVAAEISKQAARATSESGWVAGVLVLIVLCGFGAFGWLGVQLWRSHAELSKFVRETLVGTVERNSVAFSGLASLLRARPCLSDEATAIDSLAEQHREG